MNCQDTVQSVFASEFEEVEFIGLPQGGFQRSFLVTLRHGDLTIEVPFTVSGFSPKCCEFPGTFQVLNVLLGDAHTFRESGSFEEWCSELLFDPEDEEAKGKYSLVETRYQELEEFLEGADSSMEIEDFFYMDKEDLRSLCL